MTPARYIHALGSVGALSPIQSQIVATAQQYGVDPKLALAVAQQESGYNQSSVSSAGAIGIFQLMPATASGLGVDPSDPTQNIQGGVKLLSQLMAQYNGNTSLALAAYNAGPGAVARYGGIPPYSETQAYVPAVMSIYDSLSLPTDVGAGPDASGMSFSDMLATSPGLVAGGATAIAVLVYLMFGRG